MVPYITLNGISSIAKGLRLVSAAPFILPRRTAERETIPGRIGDIVSSDFSYPSIGYQIGLSASGANKAAVVVAMHDIAKWILDARVLTVWHEPECYFTGAFEGGANFNMLGRKNGVLDIEFMCNPPCRQHAKLAGAGSWIPLTTLPIAEQLDATNQSASVTSKTEAFTFASLTLDSPIKPALHMSITGTWTSLLIGGTLAITEAFASPDVLYIDCDAQEVYRVTGGVRTIVTYSGDFPTFTGGALAVDGVAFDISLARMLVVERG